MSRLVVDAAPFEAEVDVAIVGAGAAGLVAALAAREAGATPVLFERDAIPQGSTALSAGLVPAAGTRAQRLAGIIDDAETFRRDIQKKAGGRADPHVLAAATGAIGPAIDWLADRYRLPFTVIDDFLYPGHCAHRMHALPSRSGAELVDRLRAAVEGEGIDILTGAHVEALVVGPDGALRGLLARRPDGALDRIGAGAIVLACNGYGGAPDLVARHIPELAGALYFGHPGNQGDAVLWGEALGAELKDMGGHQGHGSVAHPHGVLITWATITEGGFQVNARGARFWNESQGYSEAARAVIAEEGGLAWTIFDERIAAVARQFEDFRRAEAAGAILGADTPEALAQAMRMSPQVIRATLESVADLKRNGGIDFSGRNWAGAPQLSPPYRAVRVTGALFHTQGGLAVDGEAQVLRADGTPIPRLFAAGGAAVGVSGPDASGYLSGNGLLTAVGLGRLAGRSAAEAGSRRHVL